MKVCNRCKKDYPDSDSFCAECGQKLQPKGIPLPMKEADGMTKRLDYLEMKMESAPIKKVPDLHRKVSTLERKVSTMSTSRDVQALRSKLVSLEKKIGSETSTIKSSLRDVDKKAERMGSMKSMPKDQALAVVNDVGQLDRKIQELNSTIAQFRQDVPKAEHILSEIEERLEQTSGALFAGQKHGLEEMANNIRALEQRVEGTERDVEDEIQRLRRDMGDREITRFLSDVEENKKKIEELMQMKNDLDDVKKRSASFNAQEIRDNVIGEFEKINTDLVESVEEKKNEIQRLEQETAQIKEGIMSLKTLEGKVGSIDSDSITRDLEILKTKTKWLEDQVEGIDIKPIHDRIGELEGELKRLTKNSPMVVE